MQANKTIFPVSSLFILAMWLIPFFFDPPGITYLYSLADDNAEWFIFDLIYYYYYHALFILLVTWLIFTYKINWRAAFGKINRKDFKPALTLTAFIYLFSIATAYALFYPLSFIFPDFVNSWYISSPPIIFSSNNSYPVLPNVLGFTLLVVLAPVIEEVAFRGFLLHRWKDVWGLNNAILLSSLIFGLAHPDPIGATAFGMAMCILYLKTQTLLLPILCHAANNFLAWLIEAGYILYSGSNEEYTLEDFQNEWQIGAICGVIVIAWSYVYLKGPRSQLPWRLPDVLKN